MEGMLNFLMPGSLWWEQIAGPSRLTAALEASLAEGHGVICEISSALSYRSVFRDNISHWASTMNVAAEQVECDDYRGENIEGYLIKKLFPSQVNAYSRRQSPLYMKNNRLLDGRLLWIRRVPAEYTKQWIQYISSYRSRDMLHGLFVMEVIQTDSQMKKAASNLRFLSVFDYITKADLRLFVSISAEKLLEASDGIRQYVVELITDVCVADAELAYQLLEIPEWYFDDPCSALVKLYQDEYADSPRGEEAWHPFALIRCGRLMDLNKRIWTAQIRIGYPKIEMERCRFIQTRYDELTDALNTRYCDIDENDGRYFCDNEGNRYTDPYDMEVGMICKLTGLIRADDGMRLFYIPDTEIRERLYLLRDCRNHLAHLEICPGNDFKKLLSDAADV